MADVILNPVINTPYAEPQRHYRFSDEGITSIIDDGRRSSSYFVPIPKPKKRGGSQMILLDEWTEDRIEENKFINDVRSRVSLWRKGGYIGITKITRQLLDYWRDEERERRLFFCQIEALETAIYITEVAPKHDPWIENTLKRVNSEANRLLFRVAFKIATGSGKTLVAAMLIAWHALNKLANTQDARFSDTFLIVAPGIPIRDRLRVLLPSDPQNYYEQHDLVPLDMRADLGRATILITNFHTFKPHDKVIAGKLTKDILSQGNGNPFVETPDQMVRRVCRELGAKKNIIVINDEAHHCYRRKPEADDGGIMLKGDELKEAIERNEEGRIWISGLEAVKHKIGVKVVYDLSATPFFIKGSGYPEGVLFPWVVSDFSLIDAIESGLTKVPRVPISDDAMTGDLPTYRYFWRQVRESLPKRTKKAEMRGTEPHLPVELQGALHSLYSNYEKTYRQWEHDGDARAAGRTPPVFIVVCNNTTVSKMVYDYIAGWGKSETMPDGSPILAPGKLPVFSNVRDGHWIHRPNTILIDSVQLESGEAMSAEYKAIAAREIDEFKADYRARFPGRDAEDLTDEDLLREVMNTVGKAGKLGEGVKCVVSVSMLTEGWDAKTVTHILGVRAFGTQLLCEQVVGRGLRRQSYVVNEQGMLEPEYAEVYGVPFSFIPSPGTSVEPPPPKPVTRVRALDDRIACEITFPRLVGYRYELPVQKLSVAFTEDSTLAISPTDVPTMTENAPIVGETSIHHLDDLRAVRLQAVAFELAKSTLEKYFRDDDGAIKAWFYPQLLDIVRRWIDDCVTCKDSAFKQLLLLSELRNDAADRIYKSIVASTKGEKRLKPLLRPYNTIGSTRGVDFDTTKPVYKTDPAKCHISHVVADTQSWEQKMAQVLEDMSEVVSYVKNQGLGFVIPYTLDGQEHNYLPDFIVRVDDGRDDLLTLIVEVSGEKRKDKAAKVSTARTLWVPAVNNHGRFGRWQFIEISDPWDAASTMRGVLQSDGQKAGVMRWSA